ncbi:MAG: CHAT domain-containing protein [Bradymonadia bacterium]
MGDGPLHIELDVAFEGADTVVCRLSTTQRDGRHGPRVWVGRHAVDTERLQGERRALGRTLKRWMRQSGARGRQIPEALTAHGRILFDLMLPPQVKSALRRWGQHHAALTLVTDDTLSAWPWPLLHDGVAPLGLRFALGARLRGGELRLEPAQSTHSGHRMLVIADPAGDLPAARVEGEALMRLSAERGGVQCDLRGGHMAVADAQRVFRGYHLLHFAGHHDPQPGGWRFGDGHLTEAHVQPLGGQGAPSLVFANACRSEDGGLVSELLRTGIRHWIGTVVDLPDLPGADFARWFYEALWTGETVGEALRQARVKAHGEGWPVWAAYRLLGHPLDAYFKVAETAQQGPTPGVRRAAVVMVKHRSPSDLTEAEPMARWRSALRRTFLEQVDRLGGTALPQHGVVDGALFGWPISFENDSSRALKAAEGFAKTWSTATVVVESGAVTEHEGVITGPGLLHAEAQVWALPEGLHVLHSVGRIAAVQAPRISVDAPLIGRSVELGHMVEVATGVFEGAGQGAITVLGPAGMGKTRLVDALIERVGHRCLVARGHNPTLGEGSDLTALAEVLCALAEVSPTDSAEEKRHALRRLLRGLDAEGDSPIEGGIASIDALLAHRPMERGPALMDRLGVLSAVLGVGQVGGGELTAPGVLPATFRRVIEGVARRTPVMVVIEDAHWMGPEGLAVIDELGLGLSQVLVVVTARPEWMARQGPERVRPGHVTVELGPLERRAAEAVARTILPLEGPALTALLTRAEGNPLFIRELAFVERDRQGDDAALPLTVEGVILARVDRLPADQQQVLRGASILGRTFWKEAVERLLGHGVGEALVELQRQRFITPRLEASQPGMTAWAFQHGLIQEVLHSSLTGASRRAWHGRAALWLSEEIEHQGPDIWPRVGQHFDAAGDHGRAAAAWSKAGHLAVDARAMGEATRALEACITADDAAPEALTVAERAEVEVLLSELVMGAGDRGRALGLLDAALARDAKAPAAVRAERWRRRAWLEDDPARKAELLTTAHDCVAEAGPQGAPELVLARAAIERDQAWRSYFQGGYAEASETLLMLLDLLHDVRRHLPTPTPPGMAREVLRLAGTVHNVRGVVANAMGDPALADQQYRCALVAFEDAGEEQWQAKTHNNLGILAEEHGRYQEAAAHHQRALRLKAALGDRPGLARSYNNLGTLAWTQGDYTRARDYLLESIRIKALSGDAGLAVGYANLSEVLLVLGEVEEAETRLLEAIELCLSGRGPGYLLPDAWRILADVRFAAGTLDGAVEAAEAALELSRAQGDAARAGAALRALAEIRDRQGDGASAIEHIKEAEAHLGPLGPSVELGQVYAAQWRLWSRRDRQRAEDAREKARALFERLEATGELARLDEPLPEDTPSPETLPPEA